MDQEELMLSIWCPVYNNESYIYETADGFINQTTNYQYEIVFHDDASTDGSVSVLERLKEEYPDKIRIIVRSENIYKKDKSALTKAMLTYCRGKYIAICEGDDYWTDPLKIQKQVDFLEQHPEYSICYHNVTTNRETNFKFYREQNGSFSLSDTLNSKQGATLAIMFRKFDFNDRLKKLFRNSLSADWSLEVVLMTMGKGYYMNEHMGFYRHHEAGITKTEDFIRRANKAKWYFILRMVFWSPKHSISFVRFLFRNRSWARH